MESMRTPLLTDQTGKALKLIPPTSESSHELMPGIDTFVWQSSADLSKIFFVSNQAQSIVHFPIDQWISEPGFWSKHIDPDHYLEILNELDHLPKHYNRINFEHQAISPGGHPILLKSSVHLVRDAQGKIERLHGLTFDLTEYKKSEFLLQKKLKENEDIKRALDQTSLVAITDPDGAITYASDLFCKSSGYSRAEILGRTHRLFLSGEHDRKFYETMWSTIKNGQIWRGEIKNKSKDGSFNWYFMTIVPFIDTTGKPYQYVAIRTDISAEKKADEQREALVRASEAIEARNQFISAASHELKTPITSLQMKLEIVLREYRRTDRKGIDETRMAKMIESSIEQTRRLTGLIDTMLDVAKIAAGKLQLKLELVELTAFVRKVINGFSEDLKGARCEAIIHGETPVWGTFDRIRIEQVITNLMNNAMKYAPGKPIEFTISSTRDRALISVRDFGMGIEKEFMKNIFSQFERANAAQKIKGNGLGLWISKKIVEAHHGTITVTSEVGKGSTFTVELPRERHE